MTNVPIEPFNLWVEMSIREISTQAKFATNAFNNTQWKGGNNNDKVFSSIHSFLSHGSMISKLLKSKLDKNDRESIVDILNSNMNENINADDLKDMVDARNHLDHNDERIARWVRDKNQYNRIASYNIGNKKDFQNKNTIITSHFDPCTMIFTFMHYEYNLEVIMKRIDAIKIIADRWVERHARLKGDVQ